MPGDPEQQRIHLCRLTPHNALNINRGKSVTRDEKEAVGRVTVDFELRNHADSIQADLGHLNRDQVRKVMITGTVDTGATQLVLPGKAARELGLPKIGEASVRFADNRREYRSVVEDAEVHLLDRKGTFNAVVEPNREDALIGAVVLETLDFVVDCGGQKLVPRDPNRIVAEIE
jgi:predicted aspartyl protease